MPPKSVAPSRNGCALSWVFEMATMSIIFLIAVAALCGIGTLHPKFNDNLLQRIGMGGMCLACLILSEHVVKLNRVDPSCLVLSGGMFLFALGTVKKVWK